MHSPVIEGVIIGVVSGVILGCFNEFHRWLQAKPRLSAKFEKDEKVIRAGFTSGDQFEGYTISFKFWVIVKNHSAEKNSVYAIEIDSLPKLYDKV